MLELANLQGSTARIVMAAFPYTEIVAMFLAVALPELIFVIGRHARRYLVSIARLFAGLTKPHADGKTQYGEHQQN